MALHPQLLKTTTVLWLYAAGTVCRKHLRRRAKFLNLRLKRIPRESSSLNYFAPLCRTLVAALQDRYWQAFYQSGSALSNTAMMTSTPNMNYCTRCLQTISPKSNEKHGYTPVQLMLVEFLLTCRRLKLFEDCPKHIEKHILTCCPNLPPMSSPRLRRLSELLSMSTNNWNGLREFNGC